MAIDSRNVMSTLRKMSDEQLQQYAAMHKNDPYLFPLAFQESQLRKQVRMETQASPMQQPPVVDQSLAAMTPQVAPTPNYLRDSSGAPVLSGSGMPVRAGNLPEDVGIGALPADNLKGMATGGIVAFDDGGEVPGYADGVAVKDPVQRFANQYRAVAEQVGQRLGVDPGVLIAQWGHETDWGRKTVGKYNFGNIKDVTGKGPTAYDKMEKSKASYKSYDSPEEFANDYANLIERNFPKAVGAGSDVKAFSAGLQEGKRGAYATDPNYGAKLEKTFMSMIPPAQAAAVSVDKAALIPGQRFAAPAASTKPTGFMSPEWFQEKAESLGLSRDTGRQVYNTMMAPTPLLPATTLTKTSPGLLATLGEKIYNRFVPAAGLSPEGIAALRAESELARRVTPEAQLLLTGPQAKLPGTTIPVTQAGEGITNLVQPARMVPPGPEATRLEQMAAAANARKAAQAAQGAEAGTTAAKAASLAQDVAAGESAAEKIQTASLLREAEEAARITSAAQRAQAAKTAAGLTSAAVTAAGSMGAGSPFGDIDLGATDASLGAAGLTNLLSKEDKQEAKEVGKEAVKEAGGKTSGWTAEDFIAIGLGIMSGKSQYATENIGEGGLKGLAMRQARIKEESDAAYRDALGKYYAAGAEAIERGAKERDLVAAAEKAAHDAFTALAKDNVDLMLNPAERTKLYNRLRMEKFAQYGISPTMLAGAGNKFSPADMALVEKYAGT
jgi:Mannosyl-glycoprotein endo-beta-N-acetylglucosaminidase